MGSRFAPMREVSAVVLLRPPGVDAGPLERLVNEVRATLGARLAEHLRAAGAVDVRVEALRVSDPATGAGDDIAFGALLRAFVDQAIPRANGLVIASAGAAALARSGDLRPFVGTAGSGARVARSNNSYSSDLLAIGDPAVLADVPDLPSDNALARWLTEVAGVRVADERRRWRLGVDVDTPSDVALVRRALPARDRPPIDAAVRGAGPVAAAAFSAVEDRIAASADVLAGRRGELVVSGRTSAAAIAWLERHAAARIRAIVEERGLRASSSLALGPGGTDRDASGRETPSSVRPQRPPRSVLGAVLDDRGPGAFGRVLAQLGDAAIVDTRVLLAHRCGPSEGSWPSAEDRFASDLLLADRIADPWLAELTASARDATIPVVLGGHTLVGPGVRLVAAAASPR